MARVHCSRAIYLSGTASFVGPTREYNPSIERAAQSASRVLCCDIPQVIYGTAGDVYLSTRAEHGGDAGAGLISRIVGYGRNQALPI